MRSCGGPHAAGWQLASCGLPHQRIEDSDYRLIARSLLGQAVAVDGSQRQNRLRTGERAGSLCEVPICSDAHHAFRCAVGGGVKARSSDVEAVWERIHRECGYRTERQVHVPAWDRWHWSCPACNRGRHGQQAPTDACTSCGSPVEAQREEAILDLEVQGMDRPRMYFDVTVRYCVPGDSDGLKAAAKRDGAVNAKAEGDKRLRYPAGRTPWRVVPLALETGGRHGKAALDHLRGLARMQVQRGFAGDSSAGTVTSAVIQRWGAELSVALHRALARQLCTARAAAGVAAAAVEVLAGDAGA